jgi:tight adherence protein B
VTPWLRLRLRLRLRPLRRAPDPAAAFDGVAEAVGRLAALVGAGATPAAAWTYLAGSLDDEDERRMATRIAAAAARGDPVAGLFVSDGPTAAAWRLVGVLTSVASDVGAPLAATLDRTATGLRAIGDLHRAVATSTAGPAASTRLMLVLPPATALLGWGLGFDVPGVLFGSPLGWVDVVAASALLVAGSRWSGRLSRAAGRLDPMRGLRLDLVAIGVQAGLPPLLAADRSERIAASTGVELLVDDAAAVDDAIAFARAAGVPLAALLRAEADRLRRVELGAATARASALATRLLVPLGVCVLPAFVLLGVLPIGVAVFASTGLTI